MGPALFCAPGSRRCGCGSSCRWSGHSGARAGPAHGLHAWRCGWRWWWPHAPHAAGGSCMGQLGAPRTFFAAVSRLLCMGDDVLAIELGHRCSTWPRRGWRMRSHPQRLARGGPADNAAAAARRRLPRRHAVSHHGCEDWRGQASADEWLQLLILFTLDLDTCARDGSRFVQPRMAALTPQPLQFASLQHCEWSLGGGRAWIMNGGLVVFKAAMRGPIGGREAVVERSKEKVVRKVVGRYRGASRSSSLMLGGELQGVLNRLGERADDSEARVRIRLR